MREDFSNFNFEKLRFAHKPEPAAVADALETGRKSLASLLTPSMLVIPRCRGASFVGDVAS